MSKTKKINLWPLFFIGIFSLSFSMIIWTITSSKKIQIEEDESFMQKYQDMDDNYNNIMTSNLKFLSKYDFVLTLNGKNFPLSIEDIRYSQRVLKLKSEHKNIFNIGANDLAIKVIDKNTKEVKDLDFNIKVTKSNTKKDDIFLDNNNFKFDGKSYNTNFDIKDENNWNITGNVTVGEDIGYIFIKSNAIQK